MEVMGNKKLNFIMPKIMCGVFILLFNALLSSSLFADVKVEAALDASVGYTDNVALADDSTATAATIYQVTPEISLIGNGRTFDAYLRYQLQNIYFDNNAGTGLDNYQNYHMLSGGINSELHENLLYIDGVASVYQVAESGQGLLTTDNISLSPNRGTINQFSLSPYINTRVGEYINTELRYRYTNTSGDSNVTNTSYVNQYSLNLDSGDQFNRIIWKVGASKRDEIYNNQDDLHHQEVELGLDYEIYASLDLLLTAGYEKDEYQTSGNSSTEGNYWSTGLRFNPGDRTNILLRVGQRYFGNTSEIQIRHRARNTNWRLAYIEEVTSRTSIALANQLDLIPGETQETDNELEDSVSSLLTLPELTSEAIIRKSARGGVEYTYRKIDAGFNLSQTEYTYQLSGEKERINAADLGVTWNYSVKTKFSLTNLYQRSISLTSASRERLIEWIFGVNYLATRRSSVKFEYRHADHSTDSGTGDYSKNIYLLGMNIKLR